MVTDVIRKPKKTHRVNLGSPTNKLVFSAYQGTNSSIFPLILQMYVPEGATIADVTYGRGVFWSGVDKSRYRVLASDLRDSDLPEGCTGGIDARKLPYADNSIVALVFDPPYMHTPGGTAHNGHQNFEQYYANNSSQSEEELVSNGNEPPENLPKYHEAVLDLYYRAGREAFRVIRENGVYIVKCQDEVCSNQQRLTHMEITLRLQEYGFVVEDLFVVMRQNLPGVSRLKTRQFHARKNHSYFMVYRKDGRISPPYDGERSTHSTKKSENGLTTSGGNSQLSLWYADGGSR